MFKKITPTSLESSCCSVQRRRTSAHRAKLCTALGLAALVPGLMAMSATAADRLTERLSADVPSHIADRMLDAPVYKQVDASSIMRPETQAVSKRAKVIVRLKGKPVSKHHDQTSGGRISRKEQLKYEQSNFLRRADRLAPGCKNVASTQVVLNSIFMEVDEDQIDALASDSEVYSVNRVIDYQMDLSDTVPYIGAEAVQLAGVDGSGVKVAVLDSGIDYYHADLGGDGIVADYDNDDPTSRDGTFPTAKVVEGWDFVGSDWPNTAEAPDPDPLDDGPASGHGTHVGHIIGGVGGVAPGVDLYAVKVCSSVSTSCSGIALIQGMEFAADPNGDGDTEDAVDVINMSLGSPYGQAFDDDLAAAVDNASALGILTVASAGNSGDKPYANGTPSGAATALSVAQTQVPSAVLPFISVDGTDYPAVFQDFSVAPVGLISGPLQYGDGGGGNLDGCSAFAAGSLTGKAVLVDRGACEFGLKIYNIGNAGGEFGIIGLVAPGDPFSGGAGVFGSLTTIPGYMVSQAVSTAFKAQVGLPATVNPAKGVPLIGQMVGSSARGPQHDAPTLIKPEIGAPGASVSAIAGTGVGTGPFGGTSGAAPMVAGSAALLLQSEPGLSPAEAKARLINTGETDIQTDPVSGLAPITRIGGGEVRIDRAIASYTAAWDAKTRQGALSFGYVDVDKKKVKLKKSVKVKNYSNKSRKYDVTASFRYADDEASGAVTFKLPSGKVSVKKGKSAKVKVEMTINGELLSGNTMNSGSMGANPGALTAQEFDGYLTFSDGDDTIHMPWHVLPRKAANIKGKGKNNSKKSKKGNELKFKDGVATVKLDNKGVGTAQNDAFALIATSGNLPEGGLGEQSPTPDIRAVGVNTFGAGAGCEFIWAFAINTWERQQHLLPVSHQVWLDTDQDGSDDYVVLNRDLSGLNTISDGRQVTYALDLVSGASSIFFFAEHATNTGNTVLYVCGTQIGMTAADLLVTNVDVRVVAQDFYYGGPGDMVDGITITPLGEQYLGLPDDVPGNSKGEMTVLDFGPFPGNSPEEGVLLFTNGDRGAGARGGATEATEALIYTVK